MDGIDLAWADWWVSAYAHHAVLTDRSSYVTSFVSVHLCNILRMYAFSARLFSIGSALLSQPRDSTSLSQTLQSRLELHKPITVSLTTRCHTIRPCSVACVL